MCGIVGFVAPEPAEALLREMIDAVGYRGPDDRGQYVDCAEEGAVHLGQVRLSILDLSAQGHQPFVSECGNFVIVYNGEVYNFASIRKALEARGHVFRSGTDTEVILKAYIEWGAESLQRFIGMFAFAIYDRAGHTLFLARDRAGVKPLHYRIEGRTLMFASELKSLLPHPTFDRSIERSVLPLYFQFGYVPSPYSIYRDTFKLPPAHCMTFDLRSGESCLERYWDVRECYAMPKFDRGESELADELETLLKDAFSLRMIADVPVGVFLSGGYDSALVSALLQSGSNTKLRTFTIGFEDKEFDEAAHAARIAEYLGTDHTEYRCREEDLLGMIDSLPYFYDEPYADSSAIPTMLVSKLARRDVTVALSADGGDEAFFGYSKYFALERIGRMRDWQRRALHGALRMVPSGAIGAINAMLPEGVRQSNMAEKLVKLKRALGEQDPLERFRLASSHVDPSRLDRLLIGGARRDVSGTGFEVPKHLMPSEYGDLMLMLDYTNFMLDDALTKVDRATMSVSLEGREPLLDHRIIEFMARVPMAVKYKDGTGKYLSRSVLYRYLPASIADQPKKGFTVPMKSWLEGRLNAMALEALDHPLLKEDALFQPHALEALKAGLRRRDVREPVLIWMIIVYVRWRERYR